MMNQTRGKQGRLPSPIRIALATLAFFAAAAIAPASLAGELPKAEKILDKYVEATGGMKAYKKVENRVIKASMELPGQGVSLDMTIYMAKGKLSYTLIESEMIGKMEKGTNGEVAWETSMMTGPRILEGAERSLALQSATLDLMVYWKDNFKSAETVGEEVVKERPCYKVLMVPNEGSEQTIFFDKESGLIAKTVMTVESPMGNVPLQSYADDYREVDGILMAFRGDVEVVGQKRVFTMTSVEQNVELPEDRFALPEAIKSLLDKPAEEG
jgi:hypothetical protein